MNHLIHTDLIRTAPARVACAARLPGVMEAEPCPP